MLDEEMEMAVDIGQAGFGEDIDIDLDFPAGEPDEDMDLGDFDPVHDIHNFNSDNRDELMAEGDDASYGMIDAAETDHNASAAIANDIDIELEHTVENIWQQNAAHPTDFSLDAEIDYLDEAAAVNMDAERNDAETHEWLPVPANTEDAVAIEPGKKASAEIFRHSHEIDEAVPLDDSASSHEESSKPIGEPHSDAEAAHSLEAPCPEEDRQSEYIDNVPEDETVEVATQVSARPSNSDQDEPGVSQPNADAGIEHKTPSSRQGSIEQQDSGHSGDAAQAETHTVDESLVSSGPEQLGPSVVPEPNNVEEVRSDPSQPEDVDESGDDTSEYQLGGELYNEATNDQIGDVEDDYRQDELSALVHSDSQSLETSPAQDLKDHRAAPNTDTSAIIANDRDDPIELADHYGVYISYGETDYRLFAKSEDDDPNLYFLTDRSALDLPLGRFLTSLRDVISEEVSPLDDLAMRVDGLGIDFSESTTSDFLGKFTFGDLVVLYDKLVKNEQPKSCPPIYTYLTVRPNCVRRMMALGESANSGRGLSEVALYRDSSSIDEEGANDVESPDTDISNGDYNDDESDSIYPQEDFEDDDSTHDDEQQPSPLVAIETQLEHIVDQDKEIGELGNDEEQRSAGNSTNAIDEPDVFISKQGICPPVFQCSFPCTRDSTCPCDGCYEVELQHLAASMGPEVRPVPGTVMPTHSSSTRMNWMTNNTMIEDHATNEPSASQSQEPNENEPQPASTASDASESKLQAPKITLAKSSADIPSSENTSVTATLTGEEHDEIDYSSDEDHEDPEDHDRDLDGSNMQKQSSGTTPDLNALVDDEITWESDDEEAQNEETKDGLAEDTVQVSPVSLKRARSELEALDGTGDKNDNKRRRS